MIEVNRAIVIGLGRDGSQAVSKVAEHIHERLGGGLQVVQVITINGSLDDMPPAQGGRPSSGGDNDSFHTHLTLQRRSAGGYVQADGFNDLDDVEDTSIVRPTDAARQSSNGKAGVPHQSAQVNLTGQSEASPRWLPVDAAMLKNDDRSMGRLLFWENGIDVQDAIELAAERIFDKENPTILQKRGFAESHANQLHVFICANTADPIASGMLIDVAYLARNILTKARNEEFVPHFWGLLTLAGIPTNQMEAGDSQEPASRARQRQRLLANARSYATLKELDYYMDRRSENRYRGGYPSPFGFIEVSDEGQAPFNYVYVIGRDNMANLSLSDAADAANMLGEWMYQVITTPVESWLIASHNVTGYYSGKVGAYSSTGLSAYHLPSDKLHDYVSFRLALQLVTERLLNEPVGIKPDADITSEFRGANQVELDGLTVDLQKLDGLDQNTRGAISKYMQRFETDTGILPYESELTEREIVKQYNNRLTFVLGRIEEQLGKMLRVKQDTLVTALRQERDRQLDRDDSNMGGTPGRSHLFFNYLLKNLRQNKDKAVRNLTTRERSLGKFNNDIKEARKLYRLGANSFGNIPLFKETPPTIFLWHARWNVVFVGLMLALAYYSWAFMSNTLSRPLGGGLLGAGMLVILVVGIAQAVRWLLSSRDSLIESHYTRLQALREQLVLQHAVQYYDFAIKQVEEVLKQINEFIDTLKSTQSSFHVPAGGDAETRLLESVTGSFQEAVLTKQNIEVLYKVHVERTELAANALSNAAKSASGATGNNRVLVDLSTAWRTLRDEHGPLHTWRDPEGRREPSDIILKFARAYMADIKLHSVDSLLSKRTDAEIVEGVRQRLDLASPFWQINKMAHSDLNMRSGAQSYRVLTVDPPSTSKFYQRINQWNDVREVDVVLSGDDKYTLFMGNYSGWPLFAVTSVMNMRQHYTQLFNQGWIAQLHTTRDSVVFPDLLPTSDAIVDVPERYSGTPFNPQLVVALGVALKVLTEADGSFNFQYVDEADELLELARQRTVSLGSSKGEVCARLNDNLKLLNLLRERIDEVLNTEAGTGTSADAGEPTIAQVRAVGRAITNYKEQNVGQLEEWEELRLQTFETGILERIKALKAQVQLAQNNKEGSSRNAGQNEPVSVPPTD
ncbi:MAG: tubulin-like doman-containing protein [Chloroflexota bacterium]|nr:tubulin-like doman-containing protein [Chloroflexota bacterium]